MYLVFLGAPGAGKGTQAAIVSKRLSLAHIASGDLFREAVEKGTELGKKVRGYMEKGVLVPDEVTIQLVSERLDGQDCREGCIFDGFPRTLAQAEALDRMLTARGKALDRVVYIEVPEAELLKRLGGRWVCRRCQAPYHELTSPPKVAGVCDRCGGELYQRPDDRVETVKERLKVYFDQTVPLLDYYQAQRKLVRVNGQGGIEDVAEAIITAVSKK